MSRSRPLPVPLEEMGCVLRPEALSPPLDWAGVFRRAARVELEIGSGKGLFLIEAARARPEIDFIGIERAEKWFRRAAERIHRSGLPNIRLVRWDAFDFLARWVVPGSAAVVHVYFPDPWPKKRHARRRLLQESLYHLCARALPPEGELRVASDVDGYFTGAIAEITGLGPFRREPWPEAEEGGLPTNYAMKYRQEGRALHLARFRRMGETEGGRR